MILVDAFETDLDTPSAGRNLVKTIIGGLDRMIYGLLVVVYELFFNVATAELFNNGTIRSFYGRIQLILGVFMLFRLSILIIQIIIDPDKAGDKNTGFSSIIKRVAIGLILLAALTPINIPNPNNENDFERELNNNGLVFGVLYSLQNRILINNTIGKIVLGVKSTDQGNSADNGNISNYSQTLNTGNDLQQLANTFATSIVRVFVRINMKPTDPNPGANGQPSSDEYRTDDNMTNNNNWMCQINQNILNTYTDPNSAPSDILNSYFLTTTCANGNFQTIANNIINQNVFYKSTSRYAFVHVWPWCGIVGLIIAFVILGFTLDIAIRAIKLAILRLIAPIPIIAYMGPVSKDNVAFSNWVKALVATYVDLFLRLAIIFFAIFLVNDIMVHGLPLQKNYNGGIIGGLTIIMIIIGIFVFAREAPRFIQEVLGIKSLGSNYGLSSLMGGTARLLGGGGLSGFAAGALSTLDASTEAAAQGKAGPGVFGAWRQNSDTMARIRTGDKEAHGGLLGRAMDRMDFSTRERQAARHMAGNRDYADAKFAQDEAERLAAQTQRDYEIAKASGADRDTLEALYKKNEAMQVAAAKAKGRTEAIEKARGLYGVSPRASDIRGRRGVLEFGRYRANVMREDLEDFYKNATNDGTYRSPYKATGDDMSFDDFIEQSGNDWVPLDQKSVQDAASSKIGDHDRDVKSFTGTMDGTTLGSMGSGANPGSGPGGGQNP